MPLLDRFLRYVKIETKSNAASDTSPSSPNQLVLSQLLVDELQELGVANAHLDQYGIVYAAIPANIKTKVPTIGLVAHVDTASEMSGHNVKPRIIEQYDGLDILLNKELNEWTKVDDFPFLTRLKGHTLIVTDGTTLLGADDKAGVAQIMDLLEYLMNHPTVPHGMIQVAFTPDEEIGRGTEHFDVNKFNADFGYTLDGDQVGIIEYENFNAASADIRIKGKSIHPGSSKGKLVNSMHVAMEFHQMLPVFDNPAFTEKYEGFNHLSSFDGSINETKLHYIIRNHDAKLLEKQKSDFRTITEFLNNRYGEGTVSLILKDNYRNMKEALAGKMWVVELAQKAIQAVGLTPSTKPIRGGTDGANLTYRGLPCPNLGTGGYNYHGRFELVSLQEMQMSVEILKKICELLVKKA